MEIRLRDSRPEDSKQIVQIFKDSYNTLRKSMGGKHPDEAVDRIISLPDDTLFSIYLSGGKMVVAEVEGSGELAGFSSFTCAGLDKLLKTSYLNLIYVGEKFQGGKAGVSVGRMLNERRISILSEKGFRKVYGYASPESVSFESKYGAKFFPRFDRFFPFDQATYRYYEIELRPSMLNPLPIEPVIFDLMVHWVSIRHFLNKRLKSS
jgi:hypothetical protein